MNEQREGDANNDDDAILVDDVKPDEPPQIEMTLPGGSYMKADWSAHA